ncbi:MAG: hypothetical protein ACK4MV_16550 [Beijerinckiaceae bacterium]
MPIENTTANRDYPLVDPENQLAFDVERIISALTGIDDDIALLFAGLNGKANSTHSHSISDVTGLQAALDAKADAGGGLGISDVSGLQTALDGKASLTGATFTGSVSGVTPSTGANNTLFATTAWVRLQGYLTAVATANINDGAVTTAKIGDGQVTPAKMNNGAAVSLLGRSANSSGVRADIAAGSNGLILSRLADAVGFNTLSALLDAVIGSTPGNYLRRGASAWEGGVPDQGGMTLIGTINTTSGSSQSITGLTLTDYKFLCLVFNGVSGTITNWNLKIGGGAVTGALSPGDAVFGDVLLSLATGAFTGVFFTTGGSPNLVGDSSVYSTATTTVTVSTTTGAFDAGSVLVYGVK